jgi:hypothetical protein
VSKTEEKTKPLGSRTLGGCPMFRVLCAKRALGAGPSVTTKMDAPPHEKARLRKSLVLARHCPRKKHVLENQLLTSLWSGAAWLLILWRHPERSRFSGEAKDLALDWRGA